MSEPPPRTFSLQTGGPFYRAMLRLHLVRPSGAIAGIWLGLFGWLPMLIGEGVRLALGMPLDPTLFDISVHVRLLVALPAILVAESLIEPACRTAIESLYVGNFCDPATLDPIVAHGERRRDATWPEVVLFAAALVVGQLAFWHVVGSTGVFHGELGVGEWSFPHLWYVMVALPLSQVVMLRFLWHWLIWSAMLVRIARLPLAALATHPDHSAGLACVARPVSGFAGFSFAVGSVLAGAWGTQMLAHGTPVKAHFPTLLVFLVAMLAIAVVPLLAFSGHLYRVRRRGIVDYGDFATAYMRGFHDKWIVSRIPGERALGSSDIQSLADLGNSYQVVNNTRLFTFGIRPVLAVWFAGILPMLPLFASTLTVEHLLSRIVKIVLGGLPI